MNAEKAVKILLGISTNSFVQVGGVSPLCLFLGRNMRKTIIKF
jgi:hypothetical protein